MSEILVYNGEHWMDKLTPEQLNEMKIKYDNWDQKFAMRHKKGQVIEIRPDGFWGKEPYPRKDVFRIVIIPGVDPKDLNYLLENSEIERKRYKIDSGITKEICTVALLEDLLVTDTKAALVKVDILWLM